MSLVSTGKEIIALLHEIALPPPQPYFWHAMVVSFCRWPCEGTKRSQEWLNMNANAHIEKYRRSIRYLPNRSRSPLF
jgi:hypothetical protein